jgi:hypothetical protein
LPLFYAIGAEDLEMRDFLEYWVTLRKKDGTMQHHYDHWILGISPAAKEPRWSIIRNVLGWVDGFPGVEREVGRSREKG